MTDPPETETTPPETRDHAAADHAPRQPSDPRSRTRAAAAGGTQVPEDERLMSTPPRSPAATRIDRRLGAGGMSTVFLATDSVLEREVAIKLLAEHLAEDEDFVARFRREALAAARLQHPNVVQVFDSGEDPGSHRHYIVMEYVDGPSCADMLRDQKQLEVDETVHVIRDACHGLDYAHRAGVVHRDVKPGNLLVASESQTTKLADFGIAKAAEQTRITQVGSVLGTAAYLSPEQARGQEAGPAVGHLLAGRVRLPVPRRPAAARVLLAHRAGAQAAGGHGRADHDPPARGAGGAGPRDPRVPGARPRGALQLDAGDGAGPGRRLGGEVTDATRRLAAVDPDATRALGDVTGGHPGAAHALGARRADRGERGRAPASPTPKAQRKARARPPRSATILATLAVLMAIAAVVLALTASDGGGGLDPIDADRSTSRSTTSSSSCATTPRIGGDAVPHSVRIADPIRDSVPRGAGPRPAITSATPATSAAVGTWASTTMPITVAVAGSSDTISA